MPDVQRPSKELERVQLFCSCQKHAPLTCPCGALWYQDRENEAAARSPHSELVEAVRKGIGSTWTSDEGTNKRGYREAMAALSSLEEQLEAVTRERDERLAVNVGLIAENTALKRKLAEHPVTKALRQELGEESTPAKERQ